MKIAIFLASLLIISAAYADTGDGTTGTSNQAPAGTGYGGSTR